MSNTIPTAGDMSTSVPDYSSLKRVTISFSNDLLDASAGDIAPEFDDFFDETDVVLDTDLLQITVDQTKSLLMSCKGDTTRLSSILNEIFFKRFSLDAGKTVTLRTQAAFVAAFDEAVRRQEDQVSIIAVVSNLDFHPDFRGNNLDLIFTSQAEWLSIPTLESLLAMQSLTPSKPTGSTAKSFGSSAAITQPTSPPTNEFRHNLLPSDVKQRYDDHQDPNIIVPIQDLVPFAATTARPYPCNFFHQADIAGEKVIVRNGAVLSNLYDTKKFQKNVPHCTDVSHHGLRSWYKLFSGHGNACGVYIVPYELLSPSHGDGQGFVFGTDIPIHKSGNFFDWQNDILRALQHSSMFPVDSICADRVKNRANGYYAILALLHDSHPAFVTHPVTLCKNWPEQKPAQSIFDFHAEFTAAIALRAIYMDGCQDLNSPTMLSTFMQNCTHSSYLIASARIDQLDPATSNNLSPGNLAITLSNYLARSDSPSQLVNVPRPPPRGSPPPRYGQDSPSSYRGGGGRPYQRRINALGDESDPHYDAEFEAAMDECMPTFIHQLAHDGPELRHCMFCGVGHNHLFDKCPILNEKRFVTSFAMRVGSAYNRTLNDAFKRQKEAQGPSTPAARLHQVLGITDAPPASAPVPAAPPGAPDFLSPDFIPGQTDFPRG